VGHSLFLSTGRAAVLLLSLPPPLSQLPRPWCLGLAFSAVGGERILMLIAKLIVLIAKSII
jgi:hypothetical protein